MNKCYSLHPWEEEPEIYFVIYRIGGILFAEVSAYGLVAIDENLTAAPSLETNSIVFFIVATCTVCFPPI